MGLSLDAIALNSQLDISGTRCHSRARLWVSKQFHFRAHYDAMRLATPRGLNTGDSFGRRFGDVSISSPGDAGAHRQRLILPAAYASYSPDYLSIACYRAARRARR